MGNEASLEGGGQPGDPGSGISTAGAPGSISAPAGSGQLIKPSNGAAVGGGAAAGPTAGINSLSGRPNQINPVAGPKPSSQAGYADSRTGGGGRAEPYRLAAHDSPREQKTQGPGQGISCKKIYTGKPGSGPAQQQQKQQKPQQQQHQAPHQKTQHQPQQQQARQEPAPKPKEPEKPKVACPLCKTELNVDSGQPPNYNSCTQCHIQVCNLCGFNPTPHLVQQDKTSDLNVPAEWEGVRSWALQLFLWGPSGLQLPQVDTELGTS
ncbi:UNVERIFIED_CONTAM: hypothetical protein FKN15_062340 [Acipenser sinensis]